MKKMTVIPAVSQIRQGRIRVAAYCRVSSNKDDQEHSYETQVRYFTSLYRGSETSELVGVYADEGISGTSMDKRVEFQRLMEDCRAGKIDRIVTKSISRFARNTKDCLKSIRELKELGITIAFEKENIDTARLSDEMMITVMGGLAQEESRSISVRSYIAVSPTVTPKRRKQGILSLTPIKPRSSAGYSICISAEWVQGRSLLL